MEGFILIRLQIINFAPDRWLDGYAIFNATSGPNLSAEVEVRSVELVQFVPGVAKNTNLYRKMSPLC